jgi:hypothetical protein
MALKQVSSLNCSRTISAEVCVEIWGRRQELSELISTSTVIDHIYIKGPGDGNEKAYAFVNYAFWRYE